MTTHTHSEYKLNILHRQKVLDSDRFCQCSIHKFIITWPFKKEQSGGLPPACEYEMILNICYLMQRSNRFKNLGEFFLENELGIRYWVFCMKIKIHVIERNLMLLFRVIWRKITWFPGKGQVLRTNRYGRINTSPSPPRFHEILQFWTIQTPK